MLKNTIFLAAALTLLVYGCGETCDKEKQKEAWRKYDATIMKATKQKADLNLRDFSYKYSDIVDEAIATRKKDLELCYCDQERPEMSEADIAASKDNLRRMETKLLINTCVSYNSLSRSVDNEGVPQYAINSKNGDIVHPMYELLSSEAFDSLRYEVSVPGDTVKTKFKYHNIPIDDILARYGPFALEDRYRSFYNYEGPKFLVDIERLHNNPENWNHCGLSSAGRKTVLSLCEKYQLNQNDVLDALNTARVFCGD